jgi:hypothetical protein
VVDKLSASLKRAPGLDRLIRQEQISFARGGKTLQRRLVGETPGGELEILKDGQGIATHRISGQGRRTEEEGLLRATPTRGR